MGRTRDVDKNGLTAFERLFVEGYCLTLSLKKTADWLAMRTGAKPMSRQAARKHYHKPEVMWAIEKRLSTETDYMNSLRRTVIEGLNDCLQAQLADAFNKDGSLRNLHKMPNRAKTAVSEITVKVYDGGTSTRVKMTSKSPLYKLAMQHLRMFEDSDPMDGERRVIEDAGPTLNRRITELGDRLRKDAVPQLPDGGGAEATAV